MNEPYTPADLTGRVRGRLAAMTVAGQKVTAQVAKDPWHVMELLTASPRGLLLVVHWAGEDALGEEPAAPLVTQRVEVIVGYALGLQADVGAALVDGTAARPSLLGVVAEVRGRVLGMAFAPDATEGLFRYRGAEPVETPEGVPLAAYRLKFELDTSMPEIRHTEA